jgi:hypothetical protein
MTPDLVRQLVEAPVSDEQASALADWYNALEAQVARFPEAELKGVEPPLRSTPSPR